MSDSVSENPVKSVSRRGFLQAAATVGKVAAVATVVAAGNEIIAPLQIADYLVKGIGIDKEGSDLQKWSTLDRLQRDIVLHPEDQEKKDVLFIWLKFNLAREYGRSQGWNMAEKVVGHFLYGKGEPLDVSQELGKDLESAAKIDEISVPTVVSSMFNISLHEKDVSTTARIAAEVNLMPGMEQESQGRKITVNSVLFPPYSEVHGSESNGWKDMYFALHNFTGAIEGKVTQSKFKKGNENFVDTWNFEVTPTSDFSIADYYDWDKKSAAFEAAYPGRMATQLLTSAFGLSKEVIFEKIKSLIGEENFESLMNANVSISDLDGKLLQEKGYGTEFAITGKTPITGNLNLNIDPRFFVEGNKTK